MKKRYKVLIIIGSVIAVLIIAVVIVFSVMRNNVIALSAVKVEDVDLSTIADGTYNGSYNCFPMSAEVKVIVSGHDITDITIVSQMSGKAKEAETIVPKALDAQSLGVDTISGATTSSKIILLAIEDALKKGKD